MGRAASCGTGVPLVHEPGVPFLGAVGMRGARLPVGTGETLCPVCPSFDCSQVAYNRGLVLLVAS